MKGDSDGRLGAILDKLYGVDFLKFKFYMFMEFLFKEQSIKS